MEKMIYFSGGRNTPDWYVSQSPNIMFSKKGQEAIIFKDKESLLEAIGIIVGFDNTPGDTMLIVDVIHCESVLNMPQDLSYEVAEDKSWIKCMKCGKTSYNTMDVKHLYCGSCRKFHIQINEGE